jgi:hypothetical protein
MMMMMSSAATSTNGKPRLGGWTRIGIVASVLWALGAGGAAFYAQWKAVSGCPSCPFNSLSGCLTVAALAAFVPLLFFWLLAWVIRATYRWVRRGFGVPPSPQS